MPGPLKYVYKYMSVLIYVVLRRIVFDRKVIVFVKIWLIEITTFELTVRLSISMLPDIFTKENKEY